MIDDIEIVTDFVLSGDLEVTGVLRRVLVLNASNNENGRGAGRQGLSSRNKVWDPDFVAG